ncbi:hypothetical protein PR003_g25257 [Phytophthora rubi]|uniref:Uncharacterized protein n=1 Tax=Phytophthora rubi TaxID=129364 RepID=A0A6A3GF17_9STRA|nr:hypothetical protein PR002_g31290 [Phytophthora rubi]KAE8957078.1 hypothetical protein PR001_g31501 [Phytophthora rubi]KAE9290568.1 hypothetical protein PR003_g25257 [Phytophthora rubi]
MAIASASIYFSAALPTVCMCTLSRADSADAKMTRNVKYDNAGSGFESLCFECGPDGVGFCDACRYGITTITCIIILLLLSVVMNL